MLFAPSGFERYIQRQSPPRRHGVSGPPNPDPEARARARDDRRPSPSHADSEAGMGDDRPVVRWQAGGPGIWPDCGGFGLSRSATSAQSYAVDA